jgi:hypothetical protein
VKVFDKSEHTDGTFSRSDFAYDAEADLYVCPGGKELMTYRRAFATPRDGVMRTARSAISRASSTARRARSSPSAAQTLSPGRSFARSTKQLATGPEPSAKLRPTRSHAESGRRSRCCLRISSASSSSTGCVCGVRTGRRMSSYWPPPPRICGNWRSSSRFRRQTSPREAQRPNFTSLTTTCRRRSTSGLSTKSTRSRPSRSAL